MMIVVADFAWKTKKKAKTPDYEVPPLFSNGRHNNLKDDWAPIYYQGEFIIKVANMESMTSFKDATV